MKRLLLLFALVCLPGIARAQIVGGAGGFNGGNIGSNSSPVISSIGQPIPGVNIAICQAMLTSTAVVSNNLATLTMTGNPLSSGYLVGKTLVVTGFSGADVYFNGSFTIASVSPTTISYSLVAANATATTVGSALQQGDSLTPCAALASIFADAGLSIPLAQPIFSDGVGNWNAYAQPGVYSAQFYGPNIATTIKQYSIACVPASAVGACGAIALGDNNAFTGNDSFSHLNNVCIVDGVTYSQTDIGAGWMACYGVLPMTSTNAVNKIVIPPNPNGVCWPLTTPVTENTPGKLVLVDLSGSCISDANTTAHATVTVDYMPTGGVTSYMPQHGIINGTFINNGCTTNGGCGSSATGIAMGAVNYGGQRGEFSNLKIEGYGTGFSNANTNSWGQLFKNDTFTHNNTGASLSGAIENHHFLQTDWLLNGIGLAATGSSTDIVIDGGSTDSNTICGVDTGGSTAEITYIGHHFENINTPGNVCYLEGGNANVNLIGGIALDDNPSGTSTSWFTASTFSVFGFNAFSGGQSLAASNYIFSASGPSEFHVFDNSTTPIPQASVAFCGQGILISVISPGLFPFQGQGGICFTDGTPTISPATGFGTGANIAGTRSAAFLVNVGTSNMGTGVVIMPAAPHNWICTATNQTTDATAQGFTKVYATSPTSITFKNFTTSLVAGDWVDGDVLTVKCDPY